MFETTQVKIIEIPEIEKEATDNHPTEVIEAGAKVLPYQLLTPDQFELLLWDMFRSGYEADNPYDKARWMTTGADKGRDVWLTNKEMPVGLVQCKREAAKFSLPATLKEIIKFLFYTELDKRLLPQPDDFTFYLALSNDPNGDVDDFFQAPKIWIKNNHQEILKQAKAVKKKYTSFQTLDVEKILPAIVNNINKFRYTLLRPHELNRWLHIHQDVRNRHFIIPSTLVAPLWEQPMSQITKEKLKDASRPLSSWNKTIKSKFIIRQELKDLKQIINSEESNCYLLSGCSGSGKSSLLSKLYDHLLEQDLVVLAIKADELNKEINDLVDLGMHLKLGEDITNSLLKLSESKPLVLLVDQMDAVSEVMDQSSNRFRVLIDLILSLKDHFKFREKYPIHIVVSSRPFEASFDTRFIQLDAKKIELNALSQECVEEFLTNIEINNNSVPVSMYPAIQVPFALSLYVSLIRAGENPNKITSKNLLSRWLEKKLINGQQLDFLRMLANDMINNEVLRRPIDVYEVDYHLIIVKLEAAGVIVRYGENIGFSHQAWLDDFQAQSFKCADDICRFISLKQDGLFSRSTILRGLEYLREHNTNEYQKALDILLFGDNVRRHILHLLIDIISTSPSPNFNDSERVYKVIKHDQVLARRIAFKISVNWVNWRDLLVEYLPDLMKQQEHYENAAQWLVAESNFDEYHVVSLIDRLWGKQEDDERAFSVLSRAIASTSTTLKRVEKILSRTDVNDDAVSRYIVSLLKQKQRESGLKLLTIWINLVEHKIGIEHRFYGINKYVKEYPLQFAEVLMPWFIRIIKSSNINTSLSHSFRRSSYLNGDLDESLNEDKLLGLLQISLIELAKNNPLNFLEFIQPFNDIQFDEIQSMIATAFTSNPSGLADEIEVFLLENNFRLCLGSGYFQGEDKVNFLVEGNITMMLIEECVPYWRTEQIEHIRQAIENYDAYLPDMGLSVEIRHSSLRYNEKYRLTLLVRLPTEVLTPRRRRQVAERDCQREPKIGERSRGIGMTSIVSSPMSEEQMAKASDNDILKLFSEVIFNQDEQRRWLSYGGIVELSRAFGRFAISNSARAINMINYHFEVGVHERPAAYVVEELSKLSEIKSSQLKELIITLNQRGFKSQEWILSVSRAFQNIAKIDKGLNDEDITLLINYLDVDIEPDTNNKELSEDDEHNGALLFGNRGGSRIVPAGNYTILSAIYLGLLCRDNPEYDRWVDVLIQFIDLSKNTETWECILLFEGRQLYWANKEKVNYLIARLFTENSALFSTPVLVRTIWELVDKLDFSLLHEIIENWLSTKNPICIQAAGELMAGIIIFERGYGQLDDRWTKALDSGDINIKCGGIYAACSGWYELGTVRGSSHNVLMSCMKGNLELLSYAINSVFSFDKRMPSDELTYEVLHFITDNPLLITKLDTYRLVNCLVKLNPTPRIMKVVLTIAQNILKAQQEKVHDFANIQHADKLVELAVTLQRTVGAVKEDAMTLYEKLLDTGTYRAEEAAEVALRSH